MPLPQDFPKEERRRLAALSRTEPPRFGTAERQLVTQSVHDQMLAAEHRPEDLVHPCSWTQYFMMQLEALSCWKSGISYSNATSLCRGAMRLLELHRFRTECMLCPGLLSPMHFHRIGL